jgi:hypothetical protein
VVGLHGVRYRREVSDSLTQVTDERQFDFIPASERILASVRADPDANRLISKAVHSYFALICHHMAQLDRYPAALGNHLQSSVARSLARLPTDEVRPTLALLEEKRALIVTKLLAAA